MDRSTAPTPRPDRAVNVVLTGFMGTGKTTVGRRLAARLGYRFVDTDELIESRHGPIPDIFARLGEAGFRQLERAVADELADRSGLVIATGGRLMVDPVNAARLGSTGRVVCLWADVDTILGRVQGGAAERPLLAVDDPRARVVELLEARRPAYERFVRIDTDERSPDEVVDEIAGLLDDVAT